MLRVTKLADYGIVLLTHFAEDPAIPYTAREIAAATKLPPPIVSKILKLLSKSGILNSHRGIKGGYALARLPETISLASIIRALEGPIAITQCSDAAKDCGLQGGCPIQTNWHLINQAIHSTLDKITLAQMTRPLHPSLVHLQLTDPPALP
jgi:FeS assembly SUF system regulator